MLGLSADDRRHLVASTTGWGGDDGLFTLSAFVEMAKADLADANALVGNNFVNSVMMSFSAKSEASGMEGLGSPS